MKDLIKRSLPTILTTFLLLIAVGYMTTLIPLQIDELSNHNKKIVGLSSSCYYIGLLLGSFNIASLIIRTGHIRAYVSFCAILVVVVLMHSVTDNISMWLLLQIIFGFCVSANYVVFESWLLEIAEPNKRGKLLGIYMVALYGGSALGQLLISLPANPILAYVYTAMLVSLSVLPLTMSSIVPPKTSNHDTMNLKALFKLSHSGSVACFVSGLILAPLFGVMPVYVKEGLGFDHKAVSLAMFALIFGGMAMQMPFGKLSDSWDRRKALGLISILMILNLLLMLLMPKHEYIVQILVFIYGGLSFALYPIGISLACDHIKGANVPSVTQGMLLMYGLGSIVGPFISSLAMEKDYDGYIYYHILVCAAFLAMLIYRISQREQKPEDHMHNFVPQVTTTPLSSNLDPRIDDPVKQEHKKK